MSVRARRPHYTSTDTIVIPTIYRVVLLNDVWQPALQFHSERDRVVLIFLRLALAADLGVVVVVPSGLMRPSFDEPLQHLFPVDWLHLEAFRTPAHLHTPPDLAVILVLAGRCRVIGNDSFGLTVVRMIRRDSREGTITGRVTTASVGGLEVGIDRAIFVCPWACGELEPVVGVGLRHGWYP